jgi:chaperone modulatory protein CbpM
VTGGKVVTKHSIKLFDGSVVSEDQTVSLTELCHVTGIPADYIIAMVEYGVFEPINGKLSHIRWQFTVNCIVKAETAMRLQRDLDVNIAGAALAIELLDEIKLLRQQIH